MDLQHALVGVEHIAQSILLIRGQKVMLSGDLALLYGVEPRALVQAVRRNMDRFPPDFMFQLTREEFSILKSQSVISSWGGARRATPYAFTEQGVAMLSSVLHSPRAIQMNVAIMRAFVRLREMVGANKEFAEKLAELERRLGRHDVAIREIVDTINRLAALPLPPPEPEEAEEPGPDKPKMGFRVNEARAAYRRRKLCVR